MLANLKEIFVGSENVLIEKFRDLKDPVEVGKCIRTAIITLGIGYVTTTICNNGGINYKNTILIGSKKQLN